VLEYELPAIPEGRDVVVIDKGEEPDVIEIDNGLDADWTGELESVTFTVKLLDCAEAVGVPLIVPLEARVRPEGNAPEVTLQTYGCTPPVAERLAWNCMPAWAFANRLVAICNGAPGPALTVRVAALLVALPAELLTTTLNCVPLSEVVSVEVV